MFNCEKNELVDTGAVMVPWSDRGRIVEKIYFNVEKIYFNVEKLYFTVVPDPPQNPSNFGTDSVFFIFFHHAVVLVNFANDIFGSKEAHCISLIAISVLTMVIDGMWWIIK